MTQNSNIFRDTHWIPSAKPLLPSEIDLKLSYRDHRLHNIQRFSFSCKGTNLLQSNAALMKENDHKIKILLDLSAPIS